MALFKTTAEVKQYINVDVNMKFEKLKPSIEDAERRFIVPLLGEAFYDVFLAAYTASSEASPLSEADAALLPFIQRALAFYAGSLMVDEIGVTVGDLGIQQQFNQNSQPAPQAKVQRLIMKYITSADRSADELLDYLEAHASPTVYAPWYTSDYNTKLSGCIVYKTAIASKYIDINDSFRIFQRLKKRIKDIEASHIKRLICQEQYDVIVEQLIANTLSEANAALVEKLEPIIAKKSLYLTLPSLAISVEPEGIMMYSSNDSVVQKQVASESEKRTLMSSLREGEFGYEADEANLDAFLQENIADYPLIEESVCWTSRPEDGTMKYKPDNDPCNKHFSV
jgi:hypothetical protein